MGIADVLIFETHRVASAVRRVATGVVEANRAT